MDPTDASTQPFGLIITAVRVCLSCAAAAGEKPPRPPDFPLSLGRRVKQGVAGVLCAAGGVCEAPEPAQRPETAIQPTGAPWWAVGAYFNPPSLRISAGTAAGASYEGACAASEFVAYASTSVVLFHQQRTRGL